MMMRAEIEARIIKVIDIVIVFCWGGMLGWALKMQIG